jgi:hypothetical protein
VTRRIAALAILTLTACPQDDATDLADEVGSESTTSGMPDLPGGDATESESESTGTSDESTESTSESTSDDATDDSSDDATSDETGSEAVPTSLEVHANGQRIGYLQLALDYGFSVWDDVNEVRFTVNDQTGHVVGGPASGYYATVDCTGPRYEQVAMVPVELCGQVGEPSRRNVVGYGVLPGGFIAAPQLMMSSGDPQLVNLQSFMNGGNCFPTATQICGYPIQVTNVIPATFPLPITVVEALP